MLTALIEIASEQATPTEKTMKKCKHIFDYAALQEDAILTYMKSDMVLVIHSDEYYLSELKSRIRAGRHWFMAGHEEIPANTGVLMNVSQILKEVMSFISCKLAVPARKTLKELGHPQPKTPIQTDNSTANGLLNNTIIPKSKKSIDIQFHWMRCRDAQGEFRFYWIPGTQNWGDYWKKHHPEIYHWVFRNNILPSSKYI